DRAVQVLVQAVVAPGRVAQQERRRPPLAPSSTAGDECREVVGKALAAAQGGRPAIGDRRETGVGLAPERVHDRRERLGEVAIFTDSEAVLGHVDVAAEPIALRPERGYAATLGRAEEPRRHGVTVLVEAARDGRPVESREPLADRHAAPNGAASRGTAAPSSMAATASAVTGAKRMPLRWWPVPTTRFWSSACRPITGPGA